MVNRFVILIVVSILAACAETRDGAGEYVVSSETQAEDESTEQKIDLIFINATEGSSSAGLPQELLDQHEKIQMIQMFCGEPITSPEEISAQGLSGLLLPFAGLLIDHIIKMINERIEAELKLYLASYGRTKTTMLYSDVSGDQPVAAWTCFRLTRMAAQSDAHHYMPEEPIALDLVAQIAIDRDILRVRPLRLYVSAARAKASQMADKRPLGVSASLGARAIWLQGNAGMSAEVFDVKLASAKIDLLAPNPTDRVVYFVGSDTDDSGWIDVPLPAWSTNAGTGKAAGRTAFTVTVAEAGRPPRFLETFKALFSATSGQIGGLLKDAIKKAVE